MGNSLTIPKISFEDMQNIIKNNNFLIINTLHDNEQDCLIKNTININEEITIINNKIKFDKTCKLLIYGKNCNDKKIYEKYKQLIDLGFTNIYIYTGGLFEWLLLQDVYGEVEFPTTSKHLDILKFKPMNLL